MRYKLALLLVLCWCSFSYADWYNFTLDWDNMDMNSPANIGRFTNANVSKVTRSGTQFISNGARIKFYGANICFGGNHPPKTDADWWGNYLSFFGINSLRVHHEDNFYPSGLLKNDGTTQNFNATAIDRFDYLWSKLKENGIYANMNLLVSRPFKAGDGVVNASDVLNITNPVKGVNQFDARMIELQKDFANKYLNRTNTYTGITYKDDPIVAVVEINNENNLTSGWALQRFDNDSTYLTAHETFPQFYLDELTTIWNSWLAEKYGTVDAVKSAWGLSNLDTNKTVVFNHSTSGTLQVISPAVATKTFADENATINVTTSSTDWYVQYRKSFSQLDNVVYEVNVTLSANASRTLSYSIQRSSTPYTTYKSGDFNITTTPTQYTFYFGGAENTTTEVKFFPGDIVGTVTIGNMTLKKAQTYDFIANETSLTDFTFHRPYYALLNAYNGTRVSDIRQFFNDTATDFISDMRLYLQNNLSLTSPICSMGGGASYLMSGIRESNTDYLDCHTYWDHPSFPGTAWDSNYFRQTNLSMINSTTLGTVGTAHAREQTTKTMPYSVSEYNNCYPNSYAYEFPMMAIYGLQYDWDALWAFSFSNASSQTRIASYFAMYPNPQKMIMLGVGSYIFQKSRDYNINLSSNVVSFTSDNICGVIGNITNRTYTVRDISFTPSANGTVWIYAPDNKDINQSVQLVGIVMGDVRAYNSGWNNTTGNFTWGTAPSQLERVPVTFSIPKNLAVYPMNQSGTIGDRITLTDNGTDNTFNTSQFDSPWFVVNYPSLTIDGLNLTGVRVE